MEADGAQRQREVGDVDPDAEPLRADDGVRGQMSQVRGASNIQSSVAVLNKHFTREGRTHQDEEDEERNEDEDREEVGDELRRPLVGNAERVLQRPSGTRSVTTHDGAEQLTSAPDNECPTYLVATTASTVSLQYQPASQPASQPARQFIYIR